MATFDFPGCGNSSYHENMALGIDDLVEITNIFVSRLTLGDLVVAGHSMGGLVALLYIEKYGKPVKGFISVEGNVASEDCFISREVTQYTRAEFRGAGFRNLIQKLSRLKNRGYQKYVDTLERYSSAQAIFDYSPSLVDYSDNGNLIQRFTQLEIPKVFIYGSENKGLSYIPHLRERGCEVVEVSKSDHFPFYDNPRDYYRAISNFMEKR